MAKPTVAIIVRPNVGKSTLFNRLVGGRRAIVEETAGVTRDRIYGKAQWLDKQFHLIDTGGYIPQKGDIIEDTVRRQAELASEEADVILFMLDSKAGILVDDQILAERLRKQGKPVLLVVNKIDDLNHESRLNEFYEMGLGEPFGISAVSGRAVGDMLDQVLTMLEDDLLGDEADTEATGIALVGVPNVGKSSFLNQIAKTEKSIVTDIPGTTRDSVDSFINYLGQSIRLIDTAGLRRKARVKDNIEYYSVVRTYRSIDECDVAIVMVDAERGFNTQDRQIMSDVLDRGKGLVVVVNKWDLVKKTSTTMREWELEYQRIFKPLEHIPMIFTSVTQNRRLWDVLKIALDVAAERRRTVATSDLNNFLEDALAYLSPPAVQGKHIQIKYVTQVHHEPPLFAFFTNFPDLVTVSYKRYLENRMRERYGFKGVPIKISFRAK